MNKNNDFFYRRMKELLSVSPSSKVDKNILEMAAKRLAPPTPHSILSQWLKPSLALAITVAVIIIINIKFRQQSELNQIVLSEAPEMVLNYKNMELMADAGDLSEEDWKKMGTGGFTR